MHLSLNSTIYSLALECSDIQVISILRIFLLSILGRNVNFRDPDGSLNNKQSRDTISIYFAEKTRCASFLARPNVPCLIKQYKITLCFLKNITLEKLHMCYNDVVVSKNDMISLKSMFNLNPKTLTYQTERILNVIQRWPL